MNETLFDLTLEDFKAWLESKAPDDVVGHAGMCSTCPIAEFLKEKLHLDYVAVSSSVCHADSRREDLPNWAIVFIHRIDMSVNDAAITTAEALQTLGSAQSWFDAIDATDYKQEYLGGAA